MFLIFVSMISMLHVLAVAEVLLLLTVKTLEFDVILLNVNLLEEPVCARTYTVGFYIPANPVSQKLVSSIIQLNTVPIKTPTGHCCHVNKNNVF